MKHFLTFLLFAIIIAVSFTASPSSVFADTDVDNGSAQVKKSDFTPLVGIPYIDTTDSDLSLPKYVNALYKASISIAAFLAVVKIIFAGVKYMLSDVVTTKADAKKDIRGALIGLLIVVGAVLILNTINPQLKGLKALDGPPVNVEARIHGGLTLNINTGDEVLASSVDHDVFEASCKRNGGSTSLLIKGTGSSAQRYLKCGEIQTVIPSDVYATLLDNAGVTEEEKARLIALYEKYINSNTDISKESLTLAAVDTDSDLYNYINTNVTTEEFNAMKQKYLTEGLNEADAQQETIAKIFNKNMIYVQAGDIQNVADREATTVTLCAGVSGTVIIIRTGSAPVVACMQ